MRFPSLLKNTIIPAVSRCRYVDPRLGAVVPFSRYMSSPAVGELFPETEDWVIGDKADTYHEAMVGDVLGDHYTVQRKLGKGMYSTVWMVEDMRSPKSYRGLKILTVKASATPLLHELEYMQRIHKANPHHRGYWHTLQLSDHFTHSGRRGDHLCLVMNLMADDTATFARHYDKGRLPLHLAKRVTKDIILGLEYLHDACDIIHTDIKPANILLAPRQWGQLIEQLPPVSFDEKDGICTLQSQPITLNGVDNIRAVLADFGVSCGADKVDKHFTDIIQSAALRAPEVSVGAGWGKPADIWSLGCTIYELVMGESLFPRDSSDNVMPILHTTVFGDFPQHMLNCGKYTSVHYTKEGTLKVDPGARNIWVGFLERLGYPYGDMAVFDDFLRMMLQLDPEKRATFSDLLDHQWLVDV